MLYFYPRKEQKMSFVITKEEIDECFINNTHQADVWSALYKIVYSGMGQGRPHWDDIKLVDGFPKIGHEASKYIWEKFIAFDKVHHPEVLAGGLWLNKGFSEDEKLGPWECVPAPVREMLWH
jgi:hypothetical protein